MYRIVPVLVAASVAIAWPAFAQNAGNSSATGLATGVAPGNSSGAVSPGIGPPGAPPAAGNTAIGAGISPNPTLTGAAPAAGRPTGTQRQAAGAPGVAAADSSLATASPVPGANSFTLGQARARIQRNGYTQLTGLHKDNQGIWRAKAMKDGQSANVALDYQGNVTGQ